MYSRVVFGGIFGILISLGIYFAYDWSRIVLDLAPTAWVFAVPAIALLVFLVPAQMPLADASTSLPRVSDSVSMR